MFISRVAVVKNPPVVIDSGAVALARVSFSYQSQNVR